MNIFKKKMAIILTLILVANIVCSGVISGKAIASTLPKITSLRVLETSPKKGDSVTFRIGSKGSELVQYSIYMYSPTKKNWENVSGGYSKPVKQGQIHSIKINKTLNSGNNSFSVWVKRSGKPPASRGGYDHFKSLSVNVKEPLTGGEASSKPASMKSAYILDNEQFVGKYPSIKVSANSTVKVQYRVFLYSKDSRSWVDMTDGYTAPVDPKINTSIRINAPLEKGDNSFSIWVKRANQKPSKKEGYDGFISYKVKAKEYGGGGSGGESLPANINTVSIDKSQEKLGGTPTVTLTAKSSVKVQYAVYMYSVSKATWEDVIGGYSSACDPKSPKAIKINKPLKPGDNVLSIWVKRADKKPSDAGGYDDFEKRTIKIGTSPSKVVKISSITCEEGDAIVGHRPNINVRGTSGNNEDLKYKAYIYSNKKKTWTEASEFTSSLKSGELASIKLTTPLESGYNKIQVWAKRETVSGDVYEAFKTIEVFANRPSPMKKLVVVDPGHGGRDPGAGSTSGTKEKDIALIVSLKLGKLLEASGYDVIYTRVNDNVNWNSSIQSESLRYRYTFANEKGADMFVSLHCNAGGGTGIETYYSKKYPNKDKLLSDTIQSELIKATSMVDRRSKAGNFSVINNTKMPASLVELGFIDNIRDEAKLKDPFYQDQCAEAISRAVIKTLSFQ